MLKFKISKEEYQKLSEAKQELYKEVNGEFKLDVEGDDNDLAGLKTHAEKLLEEKKLESEKRKKLEAQLAEIELQKKEDEQKSLLEQGEFDKLLEQNKQDFAEKEKKLLERAEKLEGQMKQSMIEAETTKVATELAGDNALLILPHLKDRFEVVDKDGVLSVIIKDATGLPNPAMTNDKLIEEFKANDIYKPILKGRDSSGGGAGGGTGGNGSDVSEWDKHFDPTNPDYSITKQGELEEKDSNLYTQLRDKHNLNNPMAAIQRNRMGVM